MDCTEWRAHVIDEGLVDMISIAQEKS